MDLDATVLGLAYDDMNLAFLRERDRAEAAEATVERLRNLAMGLEAEVARLAAGGL